MLGPIGVSEADEEIYRTLLRRPRVSVGELAERTGRDMAAIRRAVERLEQIGLVTRIDGHPVRLQPARPDSAVGALVSRRREELAQVELGARAMLAEMSVDEEPSPDRLVEIVVGRQAVATRFAQLVQRTEKELLVLDRPPYAAGPGSEPNVDVQRLLQSGIAVRGIYAPESLEEPGALEEARRSRAEGERARVHPDVPMKLAITDQRLALLPLAIDEMVERALVVHPCALLDALCALFELLWHSGVPVFGPAIPAGLGLAGAEHENLLSALAAGLKDDAIARQARLSTRTVRRRIADLTAALRARTRFQAGVLAERHGLLRDDPPD